MIGKNLFQIKDEPFGHFTQKKIVNNQTNEQISVIPDYGATITDIALLKKNRLYSILDGYKNEDDLIEHNLFKGAKLLPFPNRIKDGIYVFNGKQYQLPINHPQQHHAIHGFLYDKQFVVKNESVTEESASITLGHDYDGSLPGYPFQFDVELELQLHRESGLIYKTKVKNIDDCSIPVADGWHPYFTFHKKVDELFLKIPSKKRMAVDDVSIPTGEIIDDDLFAEASKIGKTKLDSAFFVKQKGRDIARSDFYDADEDVTIRIWQETGVKKYNYVQVFMLPNRESIAIEPMTSNINAFNNQDDLIVLQPGESFCTSCGVRLC